MLFEAPTTLVVLFEAPVTMEVLFETPVTATDVELAVER